MGPAQPPVGRGQRVGGLRVPAALQRPARLGPARQRPVPDQRRIGDPHQQRRAARGAPGQDVAARLEQLEVLVHGALAHPRVGRERALVGGELPPPPGGAQDHGQGELGALVQPRVVPGPPRQPGVLAGPAGERLELAAQHVAAAVAAPGPRSLGPRRGRLRGGLIAARAPGQERAERARLAGRGPGQRAGLGVGRGGGEVGEAGPEAGGRGAEVGLHAQRPGAHAGQQDVRYRLRDATESTRSGKSCVGGLPGHRAGFSHRSARWLQQRAFSVSGVAPRGGALGHHGTSPALAMSGAFSVTPRVTTCTGPSVEDRPAVGTLMVRLVETVSAE